MKKQTTFLRALRKSRPLIESCREGYICHALAYINEGGFQDRILDQLHPFDCYEAWVKRKHPKEYAVMLDILRYGNGIGVSNPFTQGRLAWIDNMIKIEESK